jgi:hypothetical protein
MNEFTSSRDPRDWNGFLSIGSVTAKSKVDALEMKAAGAASWMGDTEAVFAITLASADMEGDWTAFTGDRPGAVEVRQEVLGKRGVYLMPGQQKQPVLRMDVTAYDTEAQVNYMTVVSVIEPPPTLLDLGRTNLYLDLNPKGQYDSGDLLLATANWGTGDDGGVTFNMEDNPLVVPRGTTEHVYLVVDVGGAANQGRAVKLAVSDPWSVEAGPLPVTVEAPEGIAWYIGGYDLPITIDGLFEDWEHVFEDGNVTLHQDEQGDGPRTSLDLQGYASFIDPEPDSNRVLLYAETDPSDQVLKGTPIPLTQRERPSGGGGGGGGTGPSELPELFGDDAAQWFLKLEGAGEGISIHGIRATHVVDVRGANGIVTASSLWRYTEDVQPPWERVIENEVQAAAGGNEVEASLDITSLGAPEVALVILRGWDGPYDFGAPAVVDDPAEESRTGGALGDGQVPIPEFDDLLAPVAGTLLIYGLVRRRRRR